MRRFILIGLMLSLAGVAAYAQTPPPAAPRAAAPATPAAPAVPGIGVAVVDFEQALLESDAGKAAQAQFAKEIEPEKSRFEKLAKDIEDLQKKLTDAKTEAEKVPIRSDLDSKTREAQRTQEDAQRKSEELRSRLLGPIAVMVNKAVEQVAKNLNLALVFDPNTDPSNIIFANKASDITSDVMRIMNADYAKDPKVAAPAASVPAAPAKPNN